MATAEEIRKKLQTQSEQRINPLLKGLSMLTGGIAGEFTGVNEQIRQQRQAKRALTEENLAALQEERLMERMKAQQDEMLKRQIQLDEAQRLAATKTREKETTEKREAQRPTLIGQLRARPDYQLGGSMAIPIPALEPIESLEEQAAYEKSKQEREDEARKLKSGYTQINVPGYGTVGGTAEQISELSNKIPQLKQFLEQKPSEEPLYEVTYSTDSLTGQMKPTVRFKNRVPITEQQKILQQLFSNQEQGFGAPPPAGTVKKPEEEKSTEIPGFKVRMK